MRSPPRLLPFATRLLLGLLVMTLVAGCGFRGRPTPADGADGPSGKHSATGSGGQLTEQGARLTFGDAATVRYRPRRGPATVLVLVVREAHEGSVRDFGGLLVDRYTRSSTPYYVDVSVRNAGNTAVGSAPVPLWGVDEGKRLLPPAGFATSFEPCPSEELPADFAPGDNLRTCLVFLAPEHGTLRAVSFRPSQRFRPVLWKGRVAHD